MANIDLQQGVMTRDDRTTREVAVGGSMIEAVGGAGAVVLAILGLAGVAPFLLAAIATIAVGTALLFEGGTIASRVLRDTDFGSAHVDPELTGGLSAEGIAGLAGIVLGILALIRVGGGGALLNVSPIVIGAGMLFGTGAALRISSARASNLTGGVADRSASITHDALSAAAGAHALVGIGAVVLGILALIGEAPLTLVLVSMLALGAVVLLSGSAIGVRMFAGTRR